MQTRINHTAVIIIQTGSDAGASLHVNNNKRVSYDKQNQQPTNIPSYRKVFTCLLLLERTRRCTPGTKRSGPKSVRRHGHAAVLLMLCVVRLK
jgi:hypothetical protein